MANQSFRNRDDYRRAMELEEARKAGIAPAAVDEDGKEINPHIPQYMSNAPWYLNADQPTLRHQRNWKPKQKESRDWYDRGAKIFQAKKYRKGACANCGAMTHKTKDCVERPRAKGAKWNGKNIAADEKVEHFSLSYDGKRDKWNGYDPREYAKVQSKYEQVEQLKQEAAKKRELEEKFAEKSGDGEGGEGVAGAGPSGGEDGGFILQDEEDGGFAKVERRVRTAGGGSSGTVRNLRIREDTAKYLLNLDLKSAHYDPKSRSMRQDPNPDKEGAVFHGDKVPLREGDVQAWERLMLYSHQNEQDGSGNAHLQALPSQAELLFKEFKAKRDQVQGKSKASISDKYGNAATEEGIDKRLLFGQTERYVEYNRRGQVVAGQEAKVVSRYEEDVMVNNHTSVFGSWWCDGLWGYACCHQTLKNSYCTGKPKERPGPGEEASGATAAAEEGRKPLAARGSAASVRKDGERLANRHVAWGEHEEGIELDPEKVKEALRKQSEVPADDTGGDDRKRAFNSLGGTSDMTAEEMEAYRIKKMRPDDPMLNFAGKDYV